MLLFFSLHIIFTINLFCQMKYATNSDKRIMFFVVFVVSSFIEVITYVFMNYFIEFMSKVSLNSLVVR